MRPLNPNLENTHEDPEYEVRKVLGQIEWDGTLPIDLVSICEMYGLDCVFQPDENMREPGTTKFTSGGDVCIYINTHSTDCIDGFSSDDSTRRRQRFTLAHEMGHCIYKSHANFHLQKNLTSEHNPHSGEYKRKREKQANEFAAHLLIPKKAFDKFSQITGWSNMARLIEKTSEEFDVSLKVAIQQIANLADYPCISIIFDPNGIPVKTPIFSTDFKETKLFYSKESSVPKHTFAYKLLNDESSNNRGEKKFPNAATWFPDAHDWIAEKFSLKETSIRTGRYGIATILELEEQD